MQRHKTYARLTLILASAHLAMATSLTPVPAQAQVLAFPSEFQAGGIVVVTPKYEGSKSYNVIGVPIIAPAGGAGDGVVQFKGVDDLRFRLLKADGLEAGPLIGYRFGREEEDGRLLRGFGDLEGGLVVGGYVGYRAGSLFPFLSYHHQVTGDETGGIARVGLEHRTRLLSNIDLTTTVGATWASEAYTQSMFGVTALQSARSGVRAYDTGAGFKDVFIGTSADVALDQRWTLKLIGRYAHLTGDAGNSPIVESQHQLFGGLGLTYKFSIK